MEVFPMKKLPVLMIMISLLSSLCFADSQDLNERLYEAIMVDAAAIGQCLADGANVNAKDSNGSTPLMHAATFGRVEAGAVLLKNGANVNIKNKAGMTPLMCAAMSGTLEMVQLLLDHGAAVDATDKNGHNAANFAALWGFNDIANLLNTSGKSPAKSEDLNQHLLLAMARKDYPRVKELIQRGASVNTRYPKGNESLLHTAISQGNTEMADYFLAKGLDVNITDDREATPLFMTILKFNSDLAVYLLNKGAKVDFKNIENRTPLYYLVNYSVNGFTKEARQLAETLLQYGADIDERNNFDFGETAEFTALHLATFLNELEFADFLLKNGADINLPDYNGRTPLILAVQIESKEMVALLITRNANVNLPGNEGKTPLQAARELKDQGIAQLLLAAGAQ